MTFCPESGRGVASWVDLGWVKWIFSWNNVLVLAYRCVWIPKQNTNEWYTFRNKWILFVIVCTMLYLTPPLLLSRAIVITRICMICISRLSTIHGSFGCTIRSVPLRWIGIGFRAFDKLFYNRNTIRSYRDPTEIAKTFAPGFAWRSFVSTKWSQSLLGYGLPTFHVEFQESNIKRVKLGDKLQ